LASDVAVTAPHFFVDQLESDHVSITGDDAHHAARALRIRPGEEITVSDGHGTVVRARCTDVSSTRFTAEVIARDHVEQPSPVLVVFPAVPKGGKLETIVQKLTEIGVDQIRPWFSARSVVRWDVAKGAGRAQRLRTVAREAAMQSRRAWLPAVSDPGPIEQLPELTLLLHEEAAQGLSASLPSVAPRSIGVVVGPEGGLDPDEVEHMTGKGARPVSLGRPILRTETAAIVGPALVLAHYGRLG
jgi:16S rRNA (uracil1498-N3)-methyltransferase